MCPDNCNLFIYNRGRQADQIDIKINSDDFMVAHLEGIKV